MQKAASIPSTSGIYRISFPNEPRVYIGQSENLRRRAANHQGRLRRGDHHNVPLRIFSKKVDLEKFVFEILLLCPVEMLDDQERRFLEEHPVKFNFSDEPNGKRGWICSEETRTKLRASGLGRRHSAATKQRISEAQRGKKRSMEHCRKRAKGVALNAGAVLALHIDGRRAFFSDVLECRDRLGLADFTIRQCMRTWSISRSGWTFRRLNSVKANPDPFQSAKPAPISVPD